MKGMFFIAFACLLFQSECFLDSLRNHAGPNLLWRWLCHPIHVVEARPAGLPCQHPGLGDGGLYVVEDSGALVSPKPPKSQRDCCSLQAVPDAVPGRRFRRALDQNQVAS